MPARPRPLRRWRDNVATELVDDEQELQDIAPRNQAMTSGMSTQEFSTMPVVTVTAK